MTGFRKRNRTFLSSPFDAPFSSSYFISTCKEKIIQDVKDVSQTATLTLMFLAIHTSRVYSSHEYTGVNIYTSFVHILKNSNIQRWSLGEEGGPPNSHKGE